MVTTSVNIDDVYSDPYRELSVMGDYSKTPGYFELYIHSASDEKIILSKGYTGEQS